MEEDIWDEEYKYHFVITSGECVWQVTECTCIWLLLISKHINVAFLVTLLVVHWKPFST